MPVLNPGLIQVSHKIIGILGGLFNGGGVGGGEQGAYIWRGFT